MIPRPHPLALGAGLIAGLYALVVLVAGGELVAGNPGPSSCAGNAQLGPVPASGAGLAEIPARLIPLYQEAAAAYGLGSDGWAWLAAVNRIETDFGRDLATSVAGAVGWMQFEPATWAAYGVDADGDGRTDPNDPADAITAAARYLRSLGAPADWERAIRAYNGGPANAGSNSTLAYWQSAVRAALSYLPAAAGDPATPVSAAAPTPAAPIAGPPGGCQPCPAPDPSVGPDTLLAYVAPGPGQTPAGLVAPDAGCPGGGAVPLAPGDRAQIQPSGLAAAPATAPPGVRAMIAAGNQLIGRPYVYGGGHADFRLAPGYDCSSSVSFALHGAGFLTGPEDSTTLEGFGDPGAGLWVTIFANPVHTFVYIAGIRLDTSPQPGDGRLSQLGPRWRPATRATAGFVPRHPPGL
jgi:cell wall-associated NlpC family hydrolase